MTSTNKIAIILILLAVGTYYIDASLGISHNQSISLGLLTTGTTLLNSGIKNGNNKAN
jgi:hypothetical protein